MPLSFAAEMGHNSVVRILLEKGCLSESIGLNGVVAGSADKNGQTPAGVSSGCPSDGSVDEEAIGGQAIVLGAINALEHTQKQAHTIKQLLSRYNIHQGDYNIQVGFNMQLLSQEAGHLEEISVLSAVVPGPDDLPDLLEGLGMIFSPYSGVFCTNAEAHPTPVFKEGGERWDDDSFVLTYAKRGPCLSRSCTGSNVLNRQLLGIRQPSSPPPRDDGESRSSDTRGYGGPNNGIGSGGENPWPSRCGKGKQKADNRSSNSESEDEKLPEASFDVFAAISEPASDLPSPLPWLKIEGVVSSKTEIKHGNRPSRRSHIEFKKMLFQGLPDIKSAKYIQSYARVAVDTGHPITSINVNHPHKSSASMKQETVTYTVEASWMGGGSLTGGTVQASIPATMQRVFLGTLQMALTPSTTRKDTEAIAKTRILSRITQFQDAGVAWWGFRVDEEYDSEHGIELLDSNLPSLDFNYVGTARPELPEYIEVEVAAYWSMPKSTRWNLFKTKHSVPPYFNVCQVVVLKIPRNLTKSCEYVKRGVVGVGPELPIHVVEEEVQRGTLKGETSVLESQDCTESLDQSGSLDIGGI